MTIKNKIESIFDWDGADVSDIQKFLQSNTLTISDTPPKFRAPTDIRGHSEKFLLIDRHGLCINHNGSVIRDHYSIAAEVSNKSLIKKHITELGDESLIIADHVLRPSLLANGKLGYVCLLFNFFAIISVKNPKKKTLPEENSPCITSLYHLGEEVFTNRECDSLISAVDEIGMEVVLFKMNINS
jgi:hypothetical protein